MTTYTDVFGSNTVPPAEQGYRAVTLSASVELSWPEFANSADTVSAIMEVTASAGGFIITMPDAMQVSEGRDTLIRNVGAESFTVSDNDGGVISVIAAGESKYLYISDNSTAAGTWGIFTYGTGTSAADASALDGYGLVVSGSELATEFPVEESGGAVAIDATYRAKMVVVSGGADTFNLPAVATVGAGFFFSVSNIGTGLITLDGNSSEEIDGQLTKTLNPGESCFIVASSSAWYSLGYGRATEFNFTQLTKDVSAGGTITLSATEASNKLISIVGTPPGGTVLTVPATVNVYYIQCAFTGTSITLKTPLGSGVTLGASDRVIVYCDGTDVVTAQSAGVTTSLSIVNGSASAPAIFFASSPNTGIYRVSADVLGISAAGVKVLSAASTGVDLPLVPTAVTAAVNTNTTQLATTAFAVTQVASGTATLTNKTINLTSNTLTGTTAQFNTALSDGNFATQAGSETLTNKTINLTSNTLTGTTAEFNTALSDGNFATQAGSETLTNKTINLTSNTLSGTTAEFNAALSDGNFATQAGSETLTNKTLTSPTINTPSITGGTTSGMTHSSATLPSAALTGTPTAPTASLGTSTTQVATTAFVAGTAFSSALPAQAGNSGKTITTDGANASWTDPETLVLPDQTGNSGKFLATNGTTASWAFVKSFLDKSSTYTVLAADEGAVIRCTGTFTLDFTSAATLGDGWYCYVSNISTGVITLDPSGSETVNGETTATLRAGEVVLVYSDGANLQYGIHTVNQRRLPIFSTAASTADALSVLESLDSIGKHATGLSVNLSVLYGDGIFLAYDSGSAANVATSVDGETWSLRAMTATDDWDVHFDGTNWLASAGAATTINSSADGITWSAATALPGAASSTPGICGISGTWIVYGSTTVAYVSTNLGASWSTETLPASVGLSGFFKVNGKFFYWSSGTTAYYSATGLTGSWSSTTLPVTPTALWANPDGTVCFMATGVGATVYECTNETTFTDTGVLSSSSGGLPREAFGVWFALDITANECFTRHNGSNVLRNLSDTNMQTISNLSKYGATNGTTYVFGGTGGYVVAITETNSPLGTFAGI